MKCRILSLLTAPVLLVACSTLEFREAQPEKYAGFDCDELAQLSESYRPGPKAQLFDNDLSEIERNNPNDRVRRIGEPRPGATEFELEQARERRSISLARRQKGCI